MSEAKAHEPLLRVYELTSTATDDEIRQVMTLSAHIFATVPSEPNKHTSFSFWRDRLSCPGSIILFVASAANPEKPLGFCFNFPRLQEELGIETLYVWLAGVTEEARGLGIFPMLIEKSKVHARSSGYTCVTISTIPTRFEKMYSILRANGWEMIRSEETAIGQKVTMKIKV